MIVVSGLNTVRGAGRGGQTSAAARPARAGPAGGDRPGALSRRSGGRPAAPGRDLCPERARAILGTLPFAGLIPRPPPRLWIISPTRGSVLLCAYVRGTVTATGRAPM